MKVVLGNKSYERHMTSEGNELQLGLVHAGWTIVGPGYDGMMDIPSILSTHRPEILFINDKRDWDKHNPGGSFGQTHLHFHHLGILSDRPDIFRVSVLKDAGNHSPKIVEYQRQSALEISADALIVYWHPENVVEKFSPWSKPYPKLRTYHSVDAATCSLIPLDLPRSRGVVSGSFNPSVYPLRTLARVHATELGIRNIKFPGYAARGSATPKYLQTLSQFRAHVACSSVYGAALRKIIESVAVGCIPVTDLPSFDVLPEIDQFLVRVPPQADLYVLREALDTADALWSLERAREMSEAARTFYDYRAIGKRLDGLITEAANARSY